MMPTVEEQIARGTRLAAGGDLGEAVEAFNHALQLEPRSAPALLGRGMLRQEMGNLARGLEQQGEFAPKLSPDQAKAVGIVATGGRVAGAALPLLADGGDLGLAAAGTRLDRAAQRHRPACVRW